LPPEHSRLSTNDFAQPTIASKQTILLSLTDSLLTFPWCDVQNDCQTNRSTSFREGVGKNRFHLVISAGFPLTFAAQKPIENQLLSNLAAGDMYCLSFEYFVRCIAFFGYTLPPQTDKLG
jgi:hypothetical protein